MKEFLKSPAVRAQYRYTPYLRAAAVGGILGRQAYHNLSDIYRTGRGVVRRLRQGVDMARSWGRKRKRSSNNSGRKRRRTSRRGKPSYVSAQLGTVSGIGFRRNRLRPRTLRKYLWRDTIYKNHFRSAQDRTSSDVTPVGAGVFNTATFNFVSVLPDGVTTPFWVAGGGAVSSDTGVPVPLFNGDIILRGGLARASFNNNATSDSVRVRVFMVKSIYNPNFSILPGAGTAVTPTSWDPSLLPDFVKFGKVIKSWEFWLLPGQRPMTLVWPLKTRKIDQDVHVTARGQRYWWMFTISNGSNVDGAANVIQYHLSHNLSFVGDAIGTT